MKYLPLVGRILFSAIFLVTFPGAFTAQTIEYSASKGVPWPSLFVPLSGILEIIGALSIVTGYKAKWGAWLIVLYLVPVTSLHNFWSIADPLSQQLEMVHFLKNLSIIGGALILVYNGAGPFSISSEKESDQRAS